jgi:hypothetical protein
MTLPITMHNSVTPTPRPGPRPLMAALLALVALLALAFAGAWWSREMALFSLQPPGGGTADMTPAQRPDLHRTFFTIWVSLVLVMPALALVFFRRRSALAGEYWLAFWTAALLAFAVHFYWAVVVIFGNDWSRILNTARVSAPRLDTLFAVWWVLDVLIAWTLRCESAWVRAQRAGVHLLAFVLFFMGAAREGELPASRALGGALGVVTLLALIAALTTWWRKGRRRTTNVP